MVEMTTVSKDYDYMFKVVLVGDISVGKSCLLLKFADDSFSESYIATIGVDFRFRSIAVAGRTVKLHIWDTAGQERFRTITSAYYRGADAILVLYDQSDRHSYDSVKGWLEEIKGHVGDEVYVALIANKNDLEAEVQKEEVENDYPDKVWLSTSAKDGAGVEKAFTEVTKVLISRKQEADQGKALSKPSIAVELNAPTSTSMFAGCGCQ